IHVAIDVTEQVLSRKKIEENSAELQLAIEVAELGTFRVDLLRNEATYSQRIMDWFTVKEQGLSLDFLLNSIHPDDRAHCLAAIDELKRSNSQLEEFAYAASHDLKEPIRKIHFFTNRLKDQLAERLHPQDERMFERVEHASLRMNSLIDDLLLYSHVSQKPHE